MKSTMFAAALGLAVFAMQSQAEASTFTGKIISLRISSGTTPARVSILVGPHGSPCATAAWFSYENAGVGKGELWTDALIDSALVKGQRVTIVGTGACDSFAVEGVDFIDFHR
jgi:hypothetical protein